MDAMNEIEKEVTKLKANGAKSVFVAGHSLGANGAIGYGAHNSNIDGVVAIAPGHVSELEVIEISSTVALYLEVSGGLKETPEIARSQIIEWIKKVHASKN